MIGCLLGIARRDRPGGPMETLDQADVTLSGGVLGDFRGALKPGRNRRQVSVMSSEVWQAVTAGLGRSIPWEQRRANLLVDGLFLKDTTGARLVFDGGVVLHITGECDPCRRMEDVAPGLEAALLPDWRGGVLARVLEGGRVAVGQQVRIER